MLLRRHGQLIGLGSDFSILDRGDAEDLLHAVRGDLGLAKGETRFPLKSTCLDIYSRCVNVQTSLEAVLKRSFPWCWEHAEDLNRLFQAYVDIKERQSVLDYDDLLLFWHALVDEPESAESLRKRFDCVLVDEYQDTNLLQARILQRLCPSGDGLTVVGDDAQSIYSFRAATVRNILDFKATYPQATLVTLEQNYRSSQPILDAANAVMAQATEGHEKRLWSARQDGPRPVILECIDEDEQTDSVIDRVLEHRESGISLKQQAILFRASHHSLALEVDLNRRKIPYHKYGGLKFIETAHIKDLLSFLKFAENPRDSVAGIRMLMLLPGIGEKRARQLLGRFHESGQGLVDWKAFQVPQATAGIWPEFLGLLDSLEATGAASRSVAEDVGHVRRFYGPLLEIRYDRSAPRQRDLEQIESLSSRFADRATFLAEITLDPPASTQDLSGDPHLDEDYVILSTIHSAKGLEWDAVYVLHAADGNIPSDMATGTPEEVEEERRLFYVGLTRARSWLYVCHPQRYYFHGRHRGDAHSFSQLTRFITDDTRKLFECVVSPAESAADNGVAPGTTSVSTEDVRRRIKGIWS
jgi:DNA helicase-2/ATP-dependent DNA helicase PcrA